MNKEVYHEGWLIKSPPTKRIWRARWRRRWFTLKQGEIPGQFCLEYYTDRNCRKLKGVIDLDQCEQVDCGLRLEHRKQKFQNMFDVKTPRRTYYLAADSEDDMNDWVKCICQVCNLQDLSKQSGDRQYYNVGIDAFNNKPIILDGKSINPSSHPDGSAQNLDQIEINSSSSIVAPVTLQNSQANTSATDDDDDDAVAISPKSIKSESKPSSHLAPIDSKQDYYNLSPLAQEAATIHATVERSQSLRVESATAANTPTRAQSFAESSRQMGTIKKIPENLNLTDQFSMDHRSMDEPSPALSTCSGPYIPISECFSGSPVLMEADMPTTPLNSLDPRFYDTPRNHHTNIGLNLTNTEQPYSPKRNNCGATIAIGSTSSVASAAAAAAAAAASSTRPRSSGRSSPTDSESVFTDDEESVQNSSAKEPLDRNLRPSDSSVENDSIVFSYAQRFSKRPDEYKANVFRYDFAPQEIAPIVNRKLKPKISADDNGYGLITTFPTPSQQPPPPPAPPIIIDIKAKSTENISKMKEPSAPPPCIDRSLKPSTPKLETNSLRRKGTGTSLSLSIDSELYNNVQMNTLPAPKPPGFLNYFDLDHSNPPPICQMNNSFDGGNKTISNSINRQNNNQNPQQQHHRHHSGSISSGHHHQHQHHRHQPPARSVTDLSNIFPKSTIESSGIVYKSVDFIKTEAIKRTRQDTELNRAKHLFKD